MKTLSEIINIFQGKRELLREKYNVKEIGVFGSFVRGEQKELSDVDILVDFEKPVSLLQIVSIENYLSDLIGIKVEVVPKRGIRSELRESILREAVKSL